MVIFVLAVVIAVSLGVPLPVNGESMKPNFTSGEVVFVERLSRLRNEPLKYGQVVAAKFPADPQKTRLIKRVLGLPGDTISAQNGVITRNGELLSESYAVITGAAPYTEATAVTLGAGEYFLVGDNRPGSSDSRLWGAVQESDIQGRVVMVLFPFSALRFVN